jgi:hypothetical protein
VPEQARTGIGLMKNTLYVKDIMNEMKYQSVDGFFAAW